MYAGPVKSALSLILQTECLEVVVVTVKSKE